MSWFTTSPKKGHGNAAKALRSGPLIVWIKTRWKRSNPKTAIAAGLVLVVLLILGALLQVYISKDNFYQHRVAPVLEGYEYSVTLANRAHVCPHRQRAGTVGADGGWWICNDNDNDKTQEDCVVYSYGIFDNFSFDHYFAGVQKCQVHGFDPSPMGVVNKEAYERVPQAHYHTYGLGSVDQTYPANQVPFRWPGLDYLRDTNTQPWKLQRVSTTMKELGHDHLSILKVDVEGAEWDSLHDICNVAWQELYLELHFPPLQYVVTRDSRDGGMVVTRTPPEKRRLKQPPSTAEPTLLARNSKPIDRLTLLVELDKIADVFYWEPNVHCARVFQAECIEIYFKRRPIRKSHPLDLVE